MSFEIQILSVSSTNVNNASYAKIGDNITVRLAVNDTIATHDVEILNNTLSLIVTNSTNEINATLSIPNNLAIEKYATFNIGIENSLTIPINVTQENITGSNIFVDTIPPAISINGDITEYSLLQNRSTEPDPRMMIQHMQTVLLAPYKYRAKGGTVSMMIIIIQDILLRYSSCRSGGICHENVKCEVATCITLSDGFMRGLLCH